MFCYEVVVVTCYQLLCLNLDSATFLPCLTPLTHYISLSALIRVSGYNYHPSDHQAMDNCSPAPSYIFVTVGLIFKCFLSI